MAARVHGFGLRQIVGVQFLLVFAALTAFGCAAADTSSTEASSGEPSGSASMGSGGAPSASSGEGGAGGMGTGGTGGLMGDLAVCVLNKGLPQDPCVMPAELDYGTVAAGTKEMRLFRIDNNANMDALFKTVTIQSPAFSVTTVRYEVDPGDPNKL